MSWLNIQEILPPETIKEILNKYEIGSIKYYPKPRELTCYTTILLEIINKHKELVPYIIEVHECLRWDTKEKEISIMRKTVRYKDRDVLTYEDISKLYTVFRLLGLKVI